MPQLFSPDGIPYRTDDFLEYKRLLARGYREAGAVEVPRVDDLLFHPADHGYKEVLKHIEDHPEDAERVIAEEKAGKQRVSILGD